MSARANNTLAGFGWFPRAYVIIVSLVSIQFAQVVVHVPLFSGLTVEEDGQADPAPYAWLERSFTYNIPEELRAAIRVGQMVWVPFGPRRLQGIVLELSETTELDETRPVEAIVYDEPLLMLWQIELARWISRRYLAPLAECVWLFLPPGIEERVETLVELAPGAPALELTARQSALVERIRAEGSVKSTRLSPAQRSMLNTLVERGVLTKRAHVRPARARPRRVDTVQLVIPLAVARAVIAGLNRRAAALRALASAPEPLTAQQLASQTRLGAAALKALVADGIVAKQAPPARLELTRLYYDTVPALPTEQARLCVWLRERGGSAAQDQAQLELEVPDRVIATLASHGLLERAEPPAAYRLLDPSYVVPLSPAHARLERAVEFLATSREPVWISAVYAATDTTRADLVKLEQLGVLELETTQVIRDPLAGRTFTPVPPPQLTDAQAAAWAELEPALRWDPVEAGAARPGAAFLLHGVTGSGKTELYLDALDRALAVGKQGIALVPEISLTPQTIRRFGARFGDRIGILHSGLSAGERYDTWQRIRAGEIDVVIGPRSALFAPLPRLGLIVMDEEHDGSYKGDAEFLNQPPYHAREIALELARTRGVVVILGSATPDVETFARAARVGASELRLLELPQRVIAHEPEPRPPGAPVRYQELPPVEIVDLRAELREGNRSIFSRALKQALVETLARDEQAILFLNRRGSASAVVCRDCGQALRCPRCHAPYTLHQFGSAPSTEMVCHHCGKRAPIPRKCPNCGGTRIRGLGLGTEKLEQAVRDEFPLARPLRWDYDVTQGRDAHELLLDAMTRGEANVLVGTQMIAKGLDLPRVTLVGVVNADTALYLPDFRASERTFQLLTQVAGRAGRSARPGRALLQTYNPDHYAIQLAARHDYAGFAERELAFRRQTGYPPFRPLIRLLYTAASATAARDASDSLAALLNDRLRRAGILDVEIFGPAPAFYAKLRGKFRYHLLLHGRGAHTLLAAYPLPPGWRIDVDPLDLM